MEKVGMSLVASTWEDDQKPNLICAFRASQRRKKFEVKCVSSEYFHDVVDRSNCGEVPCVDTRSCALVSMNIVFALDGRSPCWANLRLPEKESSPDVGDEAAQASTERSYLIQCLAMPNLRDEFVLYVTNEKFFNISERLETNISGASLEVTLEVCKDVGEPVTADSVTLLPVNAGDNHDEDKLLLVAKRFFRMPKHVKEKEIVEIDPETSRSVLKLSGNFYSRDQLYFRVLVMKKKGSKDGNGERIVSDLGSYIVDGRTSIEIGFFILSRVPAVHSKHVPSMDGLGYEIPSVPGGLERYFSRLQNLFHVLLTEKEVKVKPLVLLAGPRGCGKDVVLSCAASHFGYKIIHADCFDLFGEGASHSKSKFSNLSNQFVDCLPCILVLECIEIIGAASDDKDQNADAIEAFQTFLDKFLSQKYAHPFVVVGTSDRKLSDIHPSVARIFVQSLSFEALKTAEVVDLLAWSIRQMGAEAPTNVLEGTASKITGYFFADIVKLVRLARNFQRKDSGFADRTVLDAKHFDRGIKIMDKLYSSKIGCAKVPCVRWQDIGGLEDVKREIRSALDMKTKYAGVVGKRLRFSGFLFYGPPGTGKTLVAKAVATECNWNFISVKGPELTSMYVGQGEQNVREVFQKARDAAPCIIFFDELDSLAQKRGSDTNGAADRIVSQLLTEMDGLQSNTGILLIGATNRPDLVDPAFMRPGRFDKAFYLGPCESPAMMVKVLEATINHGFVVEPDFRLWNVVNELPSPVTSADLYSLCANAWLEAAKEDICAKEAEGKPLPEFVVVRFEHFAKALKDFKPSITPEVIRYYKECRPSKSLGDR